MRRRSFKIRILFVLFLAFTVFFTTRKAVRPMLTVFADNCAAAYMTEILEQTVLEMLAEETADYSQLIRLEKDGTGKITAVKTDTALANRLKAKTSLTVLQKLSEKDTVTLDVPLGTLLEGDLLNGFGPKIRIRIEPVGTVQTNLIHTFTAAGINQTRHQISLRVSATAHIAIFKTFRKTEIASDFILAETLIVGDVPHFYQEQN